MVGIRMRIERMLWSPCKTISALLMINFCFRRLSQDGTDIVPSNTEVFDQVDSLVKVAVGDIASDNVDLAQASLQLLGFCLYNKDIAR